jgi:hypothetical protein
MHEEAWVVVNRYAMHQEIKEVLRTVLRAERVPMLLLLESWRYVVLRDDVPTSMLVLQGDYRCKQRRTDAHEPLILWDGSQWRSATQSLPWPASPPLSARRPAQEHQQK